jgi:hypothetical protein
MMKNVKYKISFLSQRKKILYDIMDCVEDKTWVRVNTDIPLIIRRSNLPVCKEVEQKLKKVHYNGYFNN